MFGGCAGGERGVGPSVRKFCIDESMVSALKEADWHDWRYMLWQARESGMSAAGTERLEGDRVRKRYVYCRRFWLLIRVAALLREIAQFWPTARAVTTSRFDFTLVVRWGLEEAEELHVGFCSCARQTMRILLRFVNEGHLVLKAMVLTSGILFQVVSWRIFQKAPCDRRRRDFHQLYHTSG